MIGQGDDMTPKQRVFGTIKLVLEHVRCAGSKDDLDRDYIIRALERADSWEPVLMDCPAEEGDELSD